MSVRLLLTGRHQGTYECQVTVNRSSSGNLWVSGYKYRDGRPTKSKRDPGHACRQRPCLWWVTCSISISSRRSPALFTFPTSSPISSPLVLRLFFPQYPSASAPHPRGPPNRPPIYHKKSEHHPRSTDQLHRQMASCAEMDSASSCCTWVIGEMSAHHSTDSHRPRDGHIEVAIW